MTTGNPNHLDQKLEELKEIYKELEQAQIKKNNAKTETEKSEAIKSHSSCLTNRNIKIEEIKKHIEEIENTDNETISSVLKEMEEYIKKMDCDSIQDCMEKRKWLEKFESYKAEWDKCKNQKKP